MCHFRSVNVTIWAKGSIEYDLVEGLGKLFVVTGLTKRILNIDLIFSYEGETRHQIVRCM